MDKEFIKLPELTLKALFDYSIAAYAERPVVQFVDDDPITYRQLGQNVEIIQEMLREYGIKPGRKIKKGYVIGKVSNKLMFQATKNSKHINPLKLIRI